MVCGKTCLDSWAGSGRGDVGKSWILSEILALAIERWGCADVDPNGFLRVRVQGGAAMPEYRKVKTVMDWMPVAPERSAARPITWAVQKWGPVTSQDA